jgi:hypothetical protein
MTLTDYPHSVRPELVEGLSFFADRKQGKGFDRLSPNGSLLSLGAT